MKEKEVRRQSNLLLIVLDGFGISSKKKGNAIALANTKNVDLFKKKYSYTELAAHGKAVGLERGVIGYCGHY